jgi:hypothetical protein
MKIRVLENYGGRDTREYRILPGVYEENDPALMGVTQTLLDLGKAEIVDDGDPVGLTPPSEALLYRDPVNRDTDEPPLRLDPQVVRESAVLSAVVEQVLEDDHLPRDGGVVKDESAVSTSNADDENEDPDDNEDDSEEKRERRSKRKSSRKD